MAHNTRGNRAKVNKSTKDKRKAKKAKRNTK